jgi:hypothetical protein
VAQAKNPSSVFRSVPVVNAAELAAAAVRFVVVRARSHADGWRLGRLIACEAESRHVRVPACQAFAQPVRKIVEVHAIAELAEGRCRRMRARSSFADCVTD